jgi:hypothetical protein
MTETKTRARNSFTKQFVVGGIRLKARAYKTTEGGWKIFSVGSLDIPTALLPFDVQCKAMELVRSPAFATENQAKAALLDANND